jgi:hypothetical protein
LELRKAAETETESGPVMELLKALERAIVSELDLVMGLELQMEERTGSESEVDSVLETDQASEQAKESKMEVGSE